MKARAAARDGRHDKVQKTALQISPEVFPQGPQVKSDVFAHRSVFVRKCGPNHREHVGFVGGDAKDLRAGAVLENARGRQGREFSDEFKHARINFVRFGRGHHARAVAREKLVVKDQTHSR